MTPLPLLTALPTAALLSLSMATLQAAPPRPPVAASAKVVKLYGAGGLGGLEAYQSGIVISGDGLIATADTLVLDGGSVTVVAETGARYSGEVLGSDRSTDLAIIRIDPAGEVLPHFRLAAAPAGQVGEPVYAFANMFGIAAGDEPVSLLAGVIASVAPLSVERGALERPGFARAGFDGEVYFLDAVTSNPGSAGGALVDARGRLLGMLGREARSRVTGAWVSYAIPAAELLRPVRRIVEGHGSMSVAEENGIRRVDPLAEFGFALPPEIVARTPPYIDYVRPGSPASKAGLRVDDLIVTADGLVTGSTIELLRVLGRPASRGPLVLFVQRDGDFLEVALPRVPPTADSRGRR